MKNIIKPAFILGMVSAILLFVGIGMKSTNSGNGEMILWIGILLAGIYWIWSIIQVANAEDMKPYQRRFWLIAVVAVPVFGALVFHVLHQSRDKIVT